MKEVTDARLTTIDNPYNPFDDFDNWFAYDNSKGYNCCGILARIIQSSEDLSIADNAKANEDAIDSIVALGLIPNAKKVVRTLTIE